MTEGILEDVGNAGDYPLTEALIGIPPPAITFDDVLIVPAYSEIESRATISTAITFLDQPLRIPIISANMDYITGPEMLSAMYNAGGMGILHRFSDWDIQMKGMDDLDVENVPFYFSVGIRDLEESKSAIDAVVQSFTNAVGVCIDVAHGHHKKVGDLVKWVKENHKGLKVIAGNVATADGAKFLVDAGADAVKVGIGAGSVCTTRTVAGVGVPQLSAITDVSFAVPNTPIISDGGIRGSGDILKALIAGATVVMIGSLLAGTTECPSPVVIGADGRKYRPYRGQSIFGTNGERYVKEGIEGYVEDKGPVADVLHNIQAGMKSGMSYVGANNLDELKEKGRFVPVSTHTQAENETRVRQII